MGTEDEEHLRICKHGILVPGRLYIQHQFDKRQLLWEGEDILVSESVD